MAKDAGAKKSSVPERASAISITSLNLTLIWWETNLALFEDASQQAPVGWITQRYSYIPVLQRLIDRAGMPPLLPCGSTQFLGLNLPWSSPGHHFWRYYLAGQPLERIRGMQAWRALVPVGGELEGTQTSAGDTVLPEFVLSPCGCGLTLTVSVQRPLGLFEAVDAARNVLRVERVRSKLPSESQPVDRTLPQLAEAALSLLRSAAFGATVPAGERLSAEPFTIVTFLRGRGAAGQSVAQGDDVHRALEGATRWWLTWREDQLPSLKKNTVDSRRGPSGHLVYGRRLGRAVWFPSSFDEDGEVVKNSPRALHCYDRNLVYAILQTLSLCGLAVSTGARLKADYALAPSNEECARLACGILGRLYGGTDTYRSGTIKSHIERYTSEIDALRQRFEMPALHV